MKWSEEKVKQLHDLAFAGKSNQEIAKTLGVGINDVYAKRSQLDITIDKVKAAQTETGSPKTETHSKPLPDRFQKMRELDQKRDLLKLLEAALTKADNSIVGLTLVDDGKVVEIRYKGDSKHLAFIEGDSLMAIIADVTRKCLF